MAIEKFNGRYVHVLLSLNIKSSDDACGAAGASRLASLPALEIIGELGLEEANFLDCLEVEFPSNWALFARKFIRDCYKSL
ncbi:hypothetical protein ACTXJU_08960 [Glutamicibacter ardleyensis]|uniref:hypothetical protein n=1 Tax=Glutamicibacter ardleyensis TaxID=225894 RepID=UPI003FD34C15